ncbi:endonuclease [Vibrio phage 166E36-1]
MKDKEMYPTPFIVEKGTLDRGVIPCGCAISPRYDLRQYEIKIQRELHRRGLEEEYIGGLPTDKKINNKMKILIRKSDGATYEVSLTHFFTSESGLRKRGTYLKINDDVFLDTILKRTSLTDITNLSINFETSDVNYYCNCCNSTFHTKRHYLLSGRVPCGCANSPNFKRHLPANLYLVRWYGYGNSYLKFGITNKGTDVRVNQQKAKTTHLDFEIVSNFYDKSGQLIWDCEKAIKTNMDTAVCPKKWLPDGYTETVYDTQENLDKILSIIETFNLKETK